MEFNAETVKAFARLIITLIVSAGATFGWSIDSDAVATIVLSVFAVVLIAYTWYKNENITKAAQEAQKVLDGIKHGDKKEGTD